MPGRALGFDHQRGDDRMLRKTLFYLGNFLEIDVDRAVADELDIVEAHHAFILKIYRPITGSRIDNGLADRLPDCSAPSCFEGAHDLVSGVGGRARGEPEWIWRTDSAKINA